MNKKMLTLVLIATLTFGLTGCINGDKNRPPCVPSISLPDEAKVNEEVVVTVRSTDPNGDKIAYKVRYGDGVDSEWSDYVSSGREVAFTHKYGESGDYRVKAVASDREAIGEWSEDKWIKIKSDLPPRLISILGTCLPGCEEMWKELGGTHFYGNRFGWPDYDEAERLGMKVFINIHDDISEEGIKRVVLEWKDRPVCGGYWSDSAGGHEPDITGPNLEERIRFYETVRKYDPDGIQERPVMEMMNNTSCHDFAEDVMERFRLRSDTYLAPIREQTENAIRAGRYPGWENAFSDKTHDLLLFDCYPGMGEGAIKNMENTWNKFIKVFPKKHQVIPQMQAYSYQKGGIWRQYNFWKEKMSSAEFDNPYRGRIGVCWYLDSAVRANPEMQQEIAEVNAEIAK